VYKNDYDKNDLNHVSQTWQLHDQMNYWQKWRQTITPPWQSIKTLWIKV